MLKNFIKIAFRNILKNKLNTAITIFGLTLGLGSCVFILIFADYESSFDGYHTHADNTYRVVQHTALPNETLHWNTTAYPLADALRSDFPDFEVISQISGPVTRNFLVERTAGDRHLFEETQVLFVDNFYSKIFDVDWLVGDKDTALKETASVVLTEELAQKYFDITENDYETILGQTIALQGKDPLTVTAVIKEPRGNSDHQYKMLIPYEFFKINNPYFSSNWSGNYQGSTYALLDNASNETDLESKINAWKKKYLKPVDDQRISYYLQPLKEIHNEVLYGSSPGGYIMPKRIITIAKIVAYFVLFIALVNFVNLVTAQSHYRTKEVGMRKVMGSNRISLILQSLFENALQIIMSCLLAIVLIKGLIEFVNANMTLMDLNLVFLPKHLFYITSIGATAIVMAGIYPALVFSASNPLNALRGRVQIHNNKTMDLRKALVTVQFVIVQLFVIGAIILGFQMHHLKNSDLGFDTDTTIITPMPDVEKGSVFRETLLANTEFTKMALGSGPPMAINGIQMGTNFRRLGQSPEEALEAEMKIGDIHYLDFFDLELIAGRNFLSNKETFDEFIVNETLLKSYGWSAEEAIGKEIQINEGTATIVGVVRDFHNNSLQYDISPCIILNWAYYQNNAFIKMTDSRFSGIEKIENSWQTLFTNSVFKQQFLDEAINKEYMVELLIFNGFTVFSILSILIGCLGLFGLMSFMVSKKRKEISIRKVLGATLLENISLFSKQYAKLVAVSFLIASPFVYFFMNQWLASFSYKIQPTIWMFLAGGVLTLLIAVATCSVQAVKAALANPIKSLRAE